MFSCGFSSWMSSSDRCHERGDKYCTSPTLEHKLEVFVWVRGYNATEGTVVARMVNRFQDPTNPHHRYYKHEATLPGFSKNDLSRYTLTTPNQCEFELVRAVTNYLCRKQRWAPKGWKFKCEISSGREQLLPHRDPEADPQKVVLLEREVPCGCGRGRNCFRVRTSAGRAYSTAIRRQAGFVIQDDTKSTNERRVNAYKLRRPQDIARLAGPVVTWAGPPDYLEGEQEEDGLELNPTDPTSAGAR